MTNADEELAAILTDLSNQARSGRAVDIETTANRHPHLAAELRQLWAVAQYANLAQQPTPTVTVPPAAEETNHLTLPRAFGDFELTRELGRGGMGVVYQAIQQPLGRTVAVKMVREAHLAGEEDRARFRAEAAATARLQHPNIVTVYEVGTAAGQAYLCMEYIEGVTLAERLAKDGPLPPRDAARMLAAIARGVHHAHEAGILHRDLKPSNILLEGSRGSGLGSSTAESRHVNAVTPSTLDPRPCRRRSPTSA